MELKDFHIKNAFMNSSCTDQFCAKQAKYGVDLVFRHRTLWEYKSIPVLCTKQYYSIGFCLLI